MQEILECLKDTKLFATTNIYTIIYKKNNLFIHITPTHDKLLCEGLLTFRVYSELKDIKNDIELGTIRYCIRNNTVFLGNIQTHDNQNRIRELSKHKYKTKIINLIFKAFKIFLIQKSFKIVYCTTTNTRCVVDSDVHHKLRTDYDQLFKSLGGVLENNRWKFILDEKNI